MQNATTASDETPLHSGLNRAPEPVAYNVNDLVARRLGSRSSICKLIREGKLPAKKLGRNTIVLDADLRAFLASLPDVKTTSSAPKG